MANDNRLSAWGKAWWCTKVTRMAAASMATEWRNRAWRIEAIDGTKSLIIRQSGMIGDAQAVVASCNSGAGAALRCAALRGVATSRTRVNDRRVTAARWTSLDQRFGIAVGLEPGNVMQHSVASLHSSHGASQARPTLRARGTRRSRPDKAPDMPSYCRSAGHFNGAPRLFIP